MSVSKLFIVPTPIGNLEDITQRALRTLKEVDLILAEDTRNTGKLLNHFGIDKPMLSYHNYNEHDITDNVIRKLQAGTTVAMVSDGGTPGISDPGFLLIRAAVQNEIKLECLPGAVAFVPALVCSGFPVNRFYFEGFLPQKKGRQTRLKLLSTLPFTIILYESPFRIVKLLEELTEHLPGRNVSVSREISKVYEEHIRGTAEEVLQHFKTKQPKGEFVVVIEGKPENQKDKYSSNESDDAS
jgi:16S rRNA (cytidine1402-2'-O)-methyltransferase